MKVLVVDDSPTMRRIVVQMLKRLGYKNIVEADHGKDLALARLKAEGNFAAADRLEHANYERLRVGTGRACRPSAGESTHPYGYHAQYEARYCDSHARRRKQLRNKTF